MLKAKFSTTSVFVLLALTVGWPVSLDLYLLPRVIALFAVSTVLFLKSSVDFSPSVFNSRQKIYITAFLAFTLYRFISCLWSIDPSEGIVPSIITLSSFFIFLALQLKPVYIHDFIKAIIAYNFIVVIVSLIQFLQLKNLSYPELSVITGLNANKNFLSGILFLCLPFNLLLFFKTKNRFILSLLFFNVVASLFLIIVLQTRAVWVGILVAFISLVLFKFIFFKTHVLENKRTVLYAVISVLIAIVVSFLFYKSTIANITDRLRFSNIINGESSVERLEAWKSSVNMFKEKPLTGVGEGNWQFIFPKYGIKNIPSVQSRFTVIQSPHNDFLWVLAETGMIGFILYLFILGYPVVYGLSKSIKKSPEVFVFISFLVGYYFYSFFDFPQYRVEHNILLVCLLASIFHSLVKQDSKSNQSAKRIDFKYSVYTIILCCSVFFFYRIKGEYYSKKLLTARHAKDDRNIIGYGTSSLSAFYKTDATGVPIYWYMAHAYNNLKMGSESLNCFEEAEKIAPFNFYIVGDLGAIELSVGNYEKAREHLLKAVYINEKYDDGYFNLATLFFYQKNYKTALFYARKTAPSAKHDFFIETILKQL